jgi:hypothetical protein
MSRLWSQHPNARYLDWILHDYVDHDDFWSSDIDWAAVDQVYKMYLIDLNMLWLSFRGTLNQTVTSVIEPQVALSVSAALITWPESSNLFHVPADQIAVLAGLGYPGAAIMKHIIPALPRFHEYQQLIHG